jgi:hypothetical protein
MEYNVLHLLKCCVCSSLTGQRASQGLRGTNSNDFYLTPARDIYRVVCFQENGDLMQLLKIIDSQVHEEEFQHKYVAVLQLA